VLSILIIELDWSAEYRQDYETYFMILIPIRFSKIKMNDHNQPFALRAGNDQTIV
jgi:hypothetical protein